ncbi:MAG: hypothetical protein AB8B53_00235 [Flavobacteriales bacterium]
MKLLLPLLVIFTMLTLSCDKLHRHCDGEFEHNFFHYIQSLDTLEITDFDNICVTDANCDHVILHMKESISADLAGEVAEAEEQRQLTEYEAQLHSSWLEQKAHRAEMFQRVKEEGEKYEVKWLDMKLLTYGHITQDFYGIEKNKGEVMFRNESYSFVLPFEALLINDKWKISDLGKLQKRKL